MKITHLIMIVGIFATLLFLLFSCTTIREYQADEVSDEVEEKAGETLLMADRHEIYGVECNDCHEEGVSDDTIVTGVECITCHEDYKDLAASYLDPHNAHITYSDCGDCHHAHRPSEKICQGCHSFNLQAP